MAGIRGRDAVTVHDVALQAGVSIKTVSEVVNRSGKVSPPTTARVEAAIAALGYQPNLSARRLRQGRTGVIGLAIPELSASGHFSELAALVVREAGARGLTVLVEETGGTREGELGALSGPRRSVVDGLLLNALSLRPDDLERAAGLPTVLLGEHAPGISVPHVTFDNVAAASAVTEHLLDGGRRRILVVGGDPAVSASAAQRLDGHDRALARRGLSPAPELRRTVVEWDHACGYDAVLQAHRDGVEIDAVFGLNDALALGALRALHDLGRDVPRDVAVAGIDDIVEARFSFPRLTTVDPDRPRMAVLALDLLGDRIAGREPDPALVAVPAGLRVRESTRVGP